MEGIKGESERNQIEMEKIQCNERKKVKERNSESEKRVKEKKEKKNKIKMVIKK